MKDSDRKTFKLKKNPKRNKKENDSNSSRESLEMEIKSYKQNKKISQKKTGEGEEIKFFFNEPPQSPEKKYSKFKINPISSSRTFPKPNIKLSKGKNDFNFKDILLNYVNSPERQAKTKKDVKEDKRSSVIYGNPETVLTLNGDENSNNSIIKEKNEISESSQNSKNESKSDSNSNSKQISESNSDSAEISSNNDKISKKSENKKEKSKKEISKELSYKSDNTSKYEDSSKTPSSSNKSDKNTDMEEDNRKKKRNNNEILKKEEKSNENCKDITMDIKKLTSLESNIKSNKDSCFNSYKNSLNYKTSNSNTFTTATNTHNTYKTHNTHNSSFQSLKINNKKINYNYLCWNDLSLQKKLIIQNRNNSVKKVIDLKEIVKNNFIKDENTSIMLYKLKNLNISLDIEKSYSYHFKYLANLQNQKNHYKNKSSEILSSSNNPTNRLYEKNSECSFYYPDEYYISKDNNLHKKSHVSNLFDKLREYKHNC